MRELVRDDAEPLIRRLVDGEKNVIVQSLLRYGRRREIERLRHPLGLGRSAQHEERHGLREVVPQVAADAFIGRLCLTSDAIGVQIQIALIEQLEMIRRSERKLLDHVPCLDRHDSLV